LHPIVAVSGEIFSTCRVVVDGILAGDVVTPIQMADRQRPWRWPCSAKSRA